MSKQNIEVQELAGAELILDRIERIRNDLGIIFATADDMFKERNARLDLQDDDKAPPEIQLLVGIGSRIIAIKLCCEVIKTQLEVLKELESEDNNEPTS